jgi:hypothetical protein
LSAVKKTEYTRLIFPEALCRCETWSLNIKGGTDRVFEDRVLRRIFGPRRYRRVKKAA